MNSREQFEKWMGIKMSGHAHDFGLEAWQASRAVAIEDAAKVCEAEAKECVDRGYEDISAYEVCAEAIRAMGSKD